MLLRPLGKLPSTLQDRFHATLEPLDVLMANEQLEIAGHLVMGVLKASRRSFDASPGDRAAYDTLCDAVEEWFQDEIAPPRFARTQ